MKKGWTIISFLCLTISLFAQQEIRFYAVSNVEQAAIGEPFRVTFVVEGTDFENLQLPESEYFESKGGSSQSQNTSITNGVMTKSYKFSYFIQANEEGEFEYGPASIEVDGESLFSESLLIKVGKTAIFKEEPAGESPFFRKEKKKKKKAPATIRT
ncbi:MAG: BatD family protein [Bacteroidota bacterium]